MIASDFAATAAAATERLREDDSSTGLDLREAICPSCRLAYWLAAGSWGVCPDCLDELEAVYPVRYMTGVPA